MTKFPCLRGFCFRFPKTHPYTNTGKGLERKHIRDGYLHLVWLLSKSLCFSGDHFVMYRNIQSLCCAPGTNIVLQGKYMSIKYIKSLYGWPFYNRCSNYSGPLVWGIFSVVPPQTPLFPSVLNPQMQNCRSRGTVAPEARWMQRNWRYGGVTKNNTLPLSFFFFLQHVKGWCPLLQLFRGQLYFSVILHHFYSELIWLLGFCPPLVAYGILSFLMYGIHTLHSESADSQPLDFYEIPWYDKELHSGIYCSLTIRAAWMPIHWTCLLCFNPLGLCWCCCQLYLKQKFSFLLFFNNFFFFFFGWAGSSLLQVGFL